MIRNIDKGIILMLIASTFFAIMGGFAKLLGEHLPALEITFFRNIFGVILIFAALLHTPSQSRGGKALLLVFRGLIGFLALLAYFYNMAHIPLGVAVTYNKTAPLFLAFFTWLFLNEKLPKSAIFALILGFTGILLIAKPHGLAFSKYDLLGIFSGMGAALAYTSIRELRKYYDTREIALSFMLAGTIGPIALTLLSNIMPHSKSFDFMFANFIMPHGKEWFYIIMVGTAATLSQLLMTKAYSITKAGIAGTITYSEIIFSVIIGTILGDTFPDFLTISGMLLIIIAGILVLKKG